MPESNAPGAGPATLDAQYFDGLSARARLVRLSRAGGQLRAQPLQPDGAEPETLHWPAADVRWPERTRHGQRVLHLPGGGRLQVADAAGFDTWRLDHGPRESWVVRAQQNWRAAMAAVLGLVVVLAAGYLWGVPWAARVVLLVVPPAVDQAVGEAAMAGLQQRWLRPSQIPPARQAEWRQAFAQAVQRAYPPGAVPAHHLQFAAADKALGPNAFALPGGAIVVTDELVELLQGHDDALLGVMAHELGHVRLRHGMQAWVQLALVGAATAAALGDFSTVLAGVPAVIATMGYSRDAEREADAEAVHLLRATGRSPAAMVVLFEKLATVRTGSMELPIALASHPLDEERKQRFRAAAQ